MFPLLCCSSNRSRKQRWPETHPVSVDSNLERLEVLVQRIVCLPPGTRGKVLYVTVEVLSKDGDLLAYSETDPWDTSKKGFVPMWNQRLRLPSDHKRHAHPADLPPSRWDLNSASMRCCLRVFAGACYEVDVETGRCEIPFRDLIKRPGDTLLMLCDEKHGDPILDHANSHLPVEMVVGVEPTSMPDAWPDPTEHEQYQVDTYPKHVFMMTRGTRGDVQPFVALARGMAELRGYMVTICTELKFKSFVKDNSNVSRGRIRFRPSGGDTERRINTHAAQYAMNSKSELYQFAIMAFSEAAFLNSTTVFAHHIQSFEREPKPVDLLVFGVTAVSVAALCSEYFKKPLIGFILQPSCIPSASQDWPAIMDIESHSFKMLDEIEHRLFTSHGSLKIAKYLAEHNPFSTFSLSQIRTWFNLPSADTWSVLKRADVPLIIPMRAGAFKKPSDWWPSVLLSDFIFLRRGPSGEGELGDSLDRFIAAARADGGRIGLMTFSSMPVARKTLLTCAIKMVLECKYDLRLIYVGKRMDSINTEALEPKAEALERENRLLELERADFGALFKHPDCFIVHGGLGTTVEALRMKKPVVVTGPLLMDQRFWATVCHEKGVGPEGVHIDEFSKTCVEFVNGALDPADPHSWQANASESDWGSEADDGIKANVDRFADLLATGLSPLSSV